MDEHDPVDDNEFVYRRIHANFFKPSLAFPVRPEAFRPSEMDITGLSVLRASFVQPQDTLANRDPAKVSGYFVTRLAVRDLRICGLTVVPEPIQGGPPGHAVIPELSWQAYQANKPHLRPILVQLAQLASAAIVHRPK